jgi:aerobic-type carbon monoxide dehydrogenase small subunit (CoxS/CutS family)
MSVKFFVNGVPAEFDGPEEVPLLWVVREHLNLTGSKFGCGIGICGACTMHVDGAAMVCPATAIIPCRKPGPSWTCPNAATASPA